MKYLESEFDMSSYFGIGAPELIIILFIIVIPVSIIYWLSPRRASSAGKAKNGFRPQRMMMGRKNISSGTDYEKIAGYSRAVRLGNCVLVAGTTATDGASKIVGIGDSGAQTEFIIQKIEAALQQAGAELRDVVRTRIYLTPDADWEAVARMHGKYFGDIRPANTLLYIQALVGADYLVEMEAEAIISQADTHEI